MNRFARCFVLVALAASVLPWNPAAAETKQVGTIEGITEYRFDNGLQLLLYPDKSRSTVTVNLTLFVGSRHEGYGETGMAHLLEHMLFKGTDKHQDVPKLLTEKGASFNGTTWVDRTNYYETLPASSENLEFAIQFEADRMMNSRVRREDLLSEMTVVRSEFERGENRPSSILEQRMMAVAFEWHNYGKSTIGNRSDIERVPIENLKAFYRKYYQPDNAMLVIAGRFDAKKALAHVEKYFGSIPRPKRELPKTYTQEPAQDGERSVSLRRVGDVGLVGAAYHIPAGGHPEFAAVDVMNDLLTHQPSGRLYKALIKTRLASSVSGGAYAWHDPGLMLITAEVRSQGDMPKVRETLIREIERLADAPPTKEEVDRIKQNTLKQRELSLSNTTRIAISLSEWAAQGDWRLFFAYRDRIEKVTPAAVHAVAKKYLQPSNRTLGMFIPTKAPTKVAIPSTPDVQRQLAGYKGRKAVTEGEVFDATPANIEARTKRGVLIDGVKMALLPKKTRGEAVLLSLNLRYGNLEDLKGKESAARLMPSLMTRGTKTMTYQQLRDSLTKIRATLGGSGIVGQASFSIRTKRENLIPAIKILRSILREPSFPAEEFEILRRNRLTLFESTRTSPDRIAARELRRTLFPYGKSDVRYTPELDDVIARYKKVTRDDVVELYRTHMGTAAGELVVVGDFDPEAVENELKLALGDWKAKVPYSHIPQLAFTNVKGGVRTIDTPGKADAIFMAGLVLGINDRHEDAPALIIGDFVLGGGALSSRLADRIRQKDGLSYQVGSFFSADGVDDVSRLMMMANSNPQNSPKVVAAVNDELSRLVKDGITQKELDVAKQGFLQSMKLGRTQDRSVVQLLSTTLFEQRTLAYYADLERKIAELTVEQVNAAVRKHFDPKKVVMVTAVDLKAGKSKDGKSKDGKK